MQILISNTDHKYLVVKTYSRSFFDDRKIDPKSFIGTMYGPYEIFDVVLSNDGSQYALVTEIVDVEVGEITPVENGNYSFIETANIIKKKRGRKPKIKEGE